MKKIKNKKYPLLRTDSIKIETSKVEKRSVEKDSKTNSKSIKKHSLLNSYTSINKNRRDFIDDIKNLKEKWNLSIESYKYLKELIKKLAGKERLLTIPEKKIIELEISNRKLLDWQKNRFEANKWSLKEKTKLKIWVLFENFDDYMWKGKLASFSELRNLSRILAKKI